MLVPVNEYGGFSGDAQIVAHKALLEPPVHDEPFHHTYERPEMRLSYPSLMDAPEPVPDRSDASRDVFLFFAGIAAFGFCFSLGLITG